MSRASLKLMNTRETAALVGFYLGSLAAFFGAAYYISAMVAR